MLAKAWKESKTLFFLELTGTFFSILGALLISFGAPDPNLLLIFLSYTVGSIAMGISSYIRKMPWLLFLMLFYTLTNFIGISRL